VTRATLERQRYRALVTWSLVAVVGCGGDPSTRASPSLPTTNQRCLDAARSQPTSPPFPESSRGPDGAPPPTTVPSALVEAKRISGEKLLVPDDDTKSAIRRAGVSKTTAAFKLCLDTAGEPATVEMYSSSCFPRYDSEVAAMIQSWRYSPYTVDGVAVPVCTAIVFIYSQR
jgi:hypothetical protein